MNEMLNMLIADIDSDSLMCGHDHSLPPARCITTVMEEEDMNKGDEAFVWYGSAYSEGVDLEDVPY